MEPCLFRHGKVCNGSEFRPKDTVLQWSHVFSDMVSGRRYAVHRPRGNGFNGAMSFQTW